SPDDRLLAYCNLGSRMALWKLTGGEEAFTFVGHLNDARAPWGISFSHDGRLLSSWSYDGIRLWDTVARKEVGLIPRAANCLFHPGGACLFPYGPGLERWPMAADPANPRTGVRIGPPRRLLDLSRAPSMLGTMSALSPNGNTLALGDPPHAR